MASLRELITDYLSEAKLMQLATTADSKPWICNVWFTADEDFALYWMSADFRRHSQELAENSHAAAAIVLPVQPDDPHRGIQIEGTVERLDDAVDIESAISLYKDRIFAEGRIRHDLENSRFFYKLTPKAIVLFDPLNFPNDPRQQLDLD